MTFDSYFDEQLKKFPLYTTKTKTTQESYCGILKQEYPKWEGWKVIKQEKSQGVHISMINNSKLTTLVRNFYYMNYLTIKYNNNI